SARLHLRVQDQGSPDEEGHAARGGHDRRGQPLRAGAHGRARGHPGEGGMIPCGECGSASVPPQTPGYICCPQRRPECVATPEEHEANERKLREYRCEIVVKYVYPNLLWRSLHS